MKNCVLVAGIAMSLVSVGAIAGGDTHPGKLETCMKAALAKYPGQVLSVEAEIEKGKPIYEFDIKTQDGKEMEVECDARTGKVTEVEQEVESASVEAFKAKARISEDDARKTALEKRPGEIVDVEYNIESDGMPSFEFDIVGKDGIEWEVEVDAATGKILEEEREVYQIGNE